MPPASHSRMLGGRGALEQLPPHQGSRRQNAPPSPPRRSAQAHRRACPRFLWRGRGGDLSRATREPRGGGRAVPPCDRSRRGPAPPPPCKPQGSPLIRMKLDGWMRKREGGVIHLISFHSILFHFISSHSFIWRGEQSLQMAPLVQQLEGTDWGLLSCPHGAGKRRLKCARVSSCPFVWGSGEARRDLGK